MADLRKDIISILTQCKTEIQANMASKGENASGRTSRGFKVVETADSIRLVLDDSEHATIECKPRGVGSVQVGVAPLDTLEIGRPGGNVPKGFYYIIKQWTRDKNITFGSESERQTFAYFLAKRIAREGTLRNKQPEDIYSTPVKTATERIRKDIRAAITAQVHNTITRF